MAKKRKKGKFVKYEGKTFFEDECEILWTAEILNNIVNMLRRYRESIAEMEYYGNMAWGRQDINEFNAEEQEIKQAKIELAEMSKQAIKNHLCKKCGGVIVRGRMTAQMAHSYGKTCECKK